MSSGLQKLPVRESSSGNFNWAGQTDNLDELSNWGTRRAGLDLDKNRPEARAKEKHTRPNPTTASNPSFDLRSCKAQQLQRIPNSTNRWGEKGRRRKLERARSTLGTVEREAMDRAVSNLVWHSPLVTGFPSNWTVDSSCDLIRRIAIVAVTAVRFKMNGQDCEGGFTCHFVKLN